MGERLQKLQSHAISRVLSRPTGRFAVALSVEITRDDVFGMAAEMAYRFLFAIFPLLLFLVAALGFVGETIGVDDLFEQLMVQAEPFLPEQVVEIIDLYVMGLLTTRSGTFLTIGILGTLWGAAGGVETLIKGLNRAYNVATPRPFWKRRLIALAVTVVLPPTAVALLLLAVLGRDLAALAGQWLGMGDLFVQLLASLRWPVLVVILFLTISLLYHRLPNVRHRYAWSLPGSLFAAAAWLALTQGFSLYVANFGNYDATYGSFGAAIAFLLWLYFAGVVVLIGAEINMLLSPEGRRRWLQEAAPDSQPEHRPKQSADPDYQAPGGEGGLLPAGEGHDADQDGHQRDRNR
jgi:membrane protein